MQQSECLGTDNRLCTVSDFQLLVNMEGVSFHCTGTDHQLRRNLRIGHPCCNQSENFLFTGRQELLVCRLVCC